MNPFVAGAIFGAVSGAVISLAGSDISKKPLKTMALILVMALAYAYIR